MTWKHGFPRQGLTERIKSGADATEQIKRIEIIKKRSTEKETVVCETFAALRAKLFTVGNLVLDSVSISNDEANNRPIVIVGDAKRGQEQKNHVDLAELVDIVDTKRGARIAGARGFFLMGDGLRLKLALNYFALNFSVERGFTPVQPPYFMRHDVMAKCAQLAQFDEELYKVTGEGDDKYLIATAEQPLCAFHQDEWLHPDELPIRYAGFSACFRKEAGSHGRDTLGIFRNHQFDKVEQFCITSPDESMMKNVQDFYKALKLPYRIVSVVSGALNDAAAIKYDLEAWFPASGTYRELVSCSNCTDYQSRKLGIRYGQKKNNEEKQQYVHMLNSTLVALERTICCILENYQREDGVGIPEVLQPLMGGMKFMPFKNKGKNTKRNQCKAAKG